MRAFGAGLLLLLLALALNAAKPSGEISSVAISPDAKLIAVEFAKGDASFIYTISVETGVAARLTDAKDGVESSPTFSPDGKHIAYTYWRADHKRSGIIIVNVDGSGARRWSPSSSNDLSPAFSTDNQTIIFSRSEFYGSYSPIARSHPHEWDFYAAKLDGTAVRRITSQSFYMVSPATASPDGKSIAAVTEGLETGSQIAIYSIDRPGKPVLTFQPHVPKEADHKNPILAYPNYMPDGTSILFMAASDGKHGYDYDVYRLALSTESVEKLTHEIGYATDLKVSSGGKTAVFLKWRKNWLGELTTNEIQLLDLQSRTVTPLKVSGLD